MLVPASLLIQAAIRPEKRRGPSVAICSLSGLALAWDSSSGSVLAGTLGFASTMNETSAIFEMTSNAFAGS